MRVLLLVHGFNSLSQRMFVELGADGHEVSLEFDINDATLTQAVDMFAPDVILAPFLKRAIPDHIWQNHLCLIVHPGVPGDRGPSALDWAITEGRTTWGVTVLQATGEMDAGPIWASQTFAMRPASKSSLYRAEASDAALTAVRQALNTLQTGTPPTAMDDSDPTVTGRLRPAMTQHDRQIDWTTDSTTDILRKIRSADGVPGLRDTLADTSVFLHDARPAPGLTGPPGAILATSGPAICRATVDGALWIGHLRVRNGMHSFKLPATQVLPLPDLPDRPEIPLDSASGYTEISYTEHGPVGLLAFEFYNGAISTAQCTRLLAAYRHATTRPTKVIVLKGGADFWSNGIHLNLIEAADNPAEASWQNINAIDDLAEAIIRTQTHITVAAMQGNSGAGGVFLARACDHVWAHDSVILNPHYKDMGNLYGSEFWTYLLPRHAGQENAKRITAQRLPMGLKQAISLGLVDASLGADRAGFADETARRAAALADSPGFAAALADKSARRAADEAEKPLASYRQEELEQMRRNFFGFDTSYHVARYNFVHKVSKSRTPITLARHRDKSVPQTRRPAS